MTSKLGKPEISLDKINIAVKILIGEDAFLEKRNGSIYVHFKDYNEVICKRWQCGGGQDFYPTWSRKLPTGGTGCTALSQLVRLAQGRPVLPISTWEYWCGDSMRLSKDPKLLLETIVAIGYPKHANCVLCGNRIKGGLDWWSLDGVSGPCCGWMSGCEQVIGDNNE